MDASETYESRPEPTPELGAARASDSDVSEDTSEESPRQRPVLFSGGDAWRYLAGGLGVVLLGVLLAAFGLGLGQIVISQFQARPVATHDLPMYLGVFFLFLCAVAQVGAGVAIATAGGHLVSEAWRRSTYPDEPWKWRRDWAVGRINYSRGRLVPVLWVAAVIWNLVLWQDLLPFVPVRAWLERGAHVGVVAVAFFVLLGGGLVCWAAAATWRWWRFRESVFRLSAVPGLIGGQLNGTVRTRLTPGPGDRFQVRLVCEQHPGLGGSRMTFWQPEYGVDRTRILTEDAHSVLPIHFEIPLSCRPTEWRLRNPLTWRLIVSNPGSGYRAEFPVPVFPPRAFADEEDVADAAVAVAGEEGSEP